MWSYINCMLFADVVLSLINEVALRQDGLSLDYVTASRLVK